MRHIEDEHQAALFRWANVARQKYPELDMMFHVPNGGKRDAREAARLKKQGVKPGVPDICLPVPRDAYHGLWIELKADRSRKATKVQKEWISNLNAVGYKAMICFGWDMARDAIIGYLDGDIQEATR